MDSSRRGPDQCWSWVIAMSGFTINMLLSGISRAAGIFYFALINDYEVSRREANLPFTIRNVVRNMAGPIVGVIGQSYGVQKVTIIGGICATLGISLCCLAPNVLWITILWGGLHGKASMWKCLLRVYRNPMFHLISLSLAAYCISFDPLTTVIVDYAKDKGHSDYIGKYFISILALGDLVGRLCFGWVTDKKFLSVPHFLVVSYMLQGIGFALLPFVSSFEGLLGLLAVYGVTAGTGLIMFPILVANYLESEQSLAFGCIMFFSGLVSFVVPLLIGHFRDGVGSYDGMFFIVGGVCITTGFLWLLEPWVVKLMKLEKKSIFK